MFSSGGLITLPKRSTVDQGKLLGRSPSNCKAQCQEQTSWAEIQTNPFSSFAANVLQTDWHVYTHPHTRTHK